MQVCVLASERVLLIMTEKHIAASPCRAQTKNEAESEQEGLRDCVQACSNQVALHQVKSIILS